MHGIIPLLDSSMVLLQPIIQVRVCSVLDIAAYRLTYCSRIGCMAVRRDPFWCMANNGESLLEKLLSGLHIALLAQTGINQVAICINSTIEVTPLSLDPE